MASEGAVDLAVIKKTQETLGNLVKKPALTEKLLRKPPFRFLHDIVKTVIKETGYFEGLYSKSELESDNIKDRDAKMQFLQKLIDVLKIATNENVMARPSKIVAGHEPEKTNQLLQLIAFVIKNKIDCKKAIESVISGPPKQKTKVKESTNKTVEKPAKTKTVIEKTKKDPDKNVRKEKAQSKEKEKLKPEKVKRTTKDSEQERTKKEVKKLTASVVDKPVKNAEIVEEPKKPAEKVEINSNVSVTTAPINHSQPENNEQNKLPEKIEDSNKSGPEKERKISVHSAVAENTENEKHIPEHEKRSAGKRRKSVTSAKSTSENIQQHKEDENANENSRAASSSKTQSEDFKSITAAIVSEDSSSLEVKRETTFVRENSNETPNPPRTSLRPPSVRPASARPGAPRRRDKNVEIILQPNDSVKMAGISVKVESFNSELEDDGENLVIIENSAVRDVELSNKQDDVTQVEQKGHLVQQILDTQKELVHTEDKDADAEIDTSILQKRQSSAKQMDSLRDIIQNLTRSVNPLGKLMDFIPEDIDSMQLELSMWRDSYSQAASELRKERSYTESALEPMKSQLEQINASIKEHNDLIDASRSKILQNSDKIFKLLTE